MTQQQREVCHSWKGANVNSMIDVTAMTSQLQADQCYNIGPFEGLFWSISLS